jgi:hypothetical protein
MSDGFGRRPPMTREDLKAIQQAPAGGGGASFTLPVPVRGLLLGFGVVGLLFAVYVVAMKGFGRALDRHWSESVGYPGVEDAFKRTAGTDKLLEEVHNDCKSRSDFVGRNRPKTRADVLSADEIILGRAVAYLTCLAAAQPSRFCQAAHRGHLFAAVKDYYRLKGKMREERVLSHQGPFAAQRDMLIGPTRETLPTTAQMMLASDPRVIDAFKALVAGGYLTSRDLVIAAGGWPNDLDLALREVKPTRKGCA